MDPDFCETLFFPTMNFVDSRTEFTFWVLWSAPLLVATDLRKLSSDKRAIIANPEVIAIDQDPLFTAGERVYNHSSGAQVWYRPLHNGDVAAVLYNSANLAHVPVSITWDMLGWPANATVAMRDLWQRRDIGQSSHGHTASIAPHDVLFLRLSHKM